MAKTTSARLLLWLALCGVLAALAFTGDDAQAQTPTLSLTYLNPDNDLQFDFAAVVVSGATASLNNVDLYATGSLSNPDGQCVTVSYRYRTPPNSGGWNNGTAGTCGSSVSASLTSLTHSSSYELQASLSSDFSGLAATAFTTQAPPPTPTPVPTPTPDLRTPVLRLYTYPDRYPFYDDSADRVRPLLVRLDQGMLDLDGAQATLYVDGEASPSTFTVPSTNGGLIVNVQWDTPQSHKYRLEIGEYESNDLAIEWTGVKPVIPDPETYIPDIPGAYTIAAGIVPLVLAGVVFAAFGTLPAILVFYAVFAAMAIASPVHPALWLTVLGSAIGLLFLAMAMGYRPRWN